MNDRILYQLALLRVRGIGAAYAKRLLRSFGDAVAVFQADKTALLRAGLPEEITAAILRFRSFDQLKKELAFIEQNGIRVLCYTDPAYPRRLLSLPEFPPFLFYQGVADLNAKKIVAIAGTRRPSDYGRQVTEQLVRQLRMEGLGGPLSDLVIISGLAFGIDSIAHRACLEHELPTIGVLANGLGKIYPSQHRDLSRDMLGQGGLLSSFPPATPPNLHQFALRNHLIAGLCDALVIVESKTEGGSLITAEKALEYRKKIFAVPGRLTDDNSAGCNQLIQAGQASLLTSGRQLALEMNWTPPTRNAASASAQTTLAFPETEPPPSQPLSSSSDFLLYLQKKDSSSLDELSSHSNLDDNALSAVLLRLEMEGLISPLPGKRYRLNR